MGNYMQTQKTAGAIFTALVDMHIEHSVTQGCIMTQNFKSATTIMANVMVCGILAYSILLVVNPCR